MAETPAAQAQPSPAQGRRKEVVGEVLSSRMHKTIVVEVVRKKSHAFMHSAVKDLLFARLPPPNLTVAKPYRRQVAPNRNPSPSASASVV